MENDVRKGSGKMKCKKLYLLALCALLGCLFGYTEKTSAISAQYSEYQYYGGTVSNPEQITTSIVATGNNNYSFTGSALHLKFPISNFDSGYDRMRFQIDYAITNIDTYNYLNTCGNTQSRVDNAIILSDEVKESRDGDVLICSRVIIFDISEITSLNEIFIQRFYRAQGWNQTSFSNLTSTIKYRPLGYYVYQYYSSEAKGIIGAIQGDLQDTTNALEQQNQTYQQESTDYSTAETNNNTDINQGQQDVNSGGTTLIGVVSGFKTNVLDNINTSSNDCGLNLGSPYGFNMGTIDLCYYNPPVWLTSILNVIASLALVGLAVHVFWRIINVIKGFSR